MFTEVLQGMDAARPKSMEGEHCPICEKHIKVQCHDFTCSSSLKIELKTKYGDMVTYISPKYPIEPLGVKYIQPKCSCYTANKKAYEEEMKRRDRQREKERFLEQSDEIHKDCSFDNFEVTKENEYAYRIAKQYVDVYESLKGQGIFLTGGYGVGKTHLAYAIKNELEEKDIYTLLVNTPDMFDKIKSTFGVDAAKQQKMMDMLYKSEVLILDDLGAEKPTEWVGETLYKVIDYRYKNKKNTIVTTNLNGTDLEERLGQNGARILDRLTYMCYPAEVTGKSRRKRG